ncbi:LacI family transcriptional regulator [Bacillus shivajii]|uniref:LacI family DNA-binding transcriptional regulator n=1 Tax=Bacillus shivajii TaxID=1983719 RepID=UPI001CF99600|nr:LacI family DNA-binding transcriptional regulator [Bacillus shivajii]UCZ52850.1 LacI family transcriptional regulator [Bacillus shivajii]
MNITIKDIAKRANVSITTVSRVINNQDGIGSDTRRKILEIIEEVGYRPNSIARSMVTKQTKTIGLIIPDVRNPFFPELVRGVEDIVNQSNYSVFLYNTDGNESKELESLRLIKEKKVDGIVYMCTYGKANRKFQDVVSQSDIPVVLLDRGLDNKMFHGVYVNNEKAGYIATKHLIDLHHNKIGCITGPDHIMNSKERLNGYLKALTESEIKVDKNLIVPGDYQMEGGYIAAKELLVQEKVTAIFALNDLMAFGVYQAATELGVRIPDDLSVVGFDNLKYNKLLNPKLTTIDQLAYQMGEVAAKMLLRQINKGRDIVQHSIYLEPELIVRNSTKENTIC